MGKKIIKKGVNVNENNHTRLTDDILLIGSAQREKLIF